MGNHKILKTCGSRTIRYSMYDFIQAVKDHPLLWDREHDDFHNRERREQTWHEVGKMLYEHFDSVSDQEKQNIAKTLLKRWKNTRDSFLRAHRLKQIEDERARPYIYEKELHFLLNTRPGEEPGGKLRPDLDHTVDEVLDDDEAKSISFAAPKTPQPLRKRKYTARAHPKKKRASAESFAGFSSVAESEDLGQGIERQLRSETAAKMGSTSFAAMTAKESVRSSPLRSARLRLKNQAQEPPESAGGGSDPAAATPSSSSNNEPSHSFALAVCNDDTKEEPTTNTAAASTATVGGPSADTDQAFFDTIKPHMRCMSEDQKLDFKIEVLKLLRTIKTK